MITCKCGAQCPDNATTCPNCGAALKQATPAVQKNLISIIGAVILIISTFLPLASVSLFGISINVKLLDGFEGYVCILVAVLAIVFALKGKDIVSLVSGVIAFLLWIYEISSFNDYEAIDKEIGFYVMLVGAIVLIAAKFVGKLLNKKA